MTTSPSLQALWDIEQIKQLKHRYIRYMTEERYDDMRDILTTDVEVSYSDGQYVFDDIEKLIPFLKSGMVQTNGNIVYWMAGMPEITLEDETHATGIWAFYHYHLGTNNGEANEMFAYYRDEYRKEGDQWRINKTGYTTVIDRIIDRKDVPFILNKPQWATATNPTK